MGWSNCGEDSQGRPIGYSFSATCDHPGCGEAIHRGLAYVCGDMHGDDEHSCEGYFCEKHRHIAEFKDGKLLLICQQCVDLAAKNGLLMDEEEDEKELADIARGMGLSDANELRELAEDLVGRAREMEGELITSVAGKTQCPVCARDADWRREGQAWTTECECGYAAAGQVPMSKISTVKH